MIDAIHEYNPWWENNYTQENIIPREKYLEILRRNVGNEQIIFLTGLRRIGKTTLMKLMINELISKK